MTNKFQNKYRIPSARLQNWNYGSNGAYFITICTYNRAHYFGEITNDVMEMNEIGKLAEKYWIEIPNHFPFIELGEFVVMPNHIHGILTINKNDDNMNVETLQCNVSTTTTTTTTGATTTGAKNEQMANISPQSVTISTIIRSFKSAVTTNARKIHADFAWQTRFHDHIIRNDAEYQRIQNYIANNPINWKEDKFYE